MPFVCVCFFLLSFSLSLVVFFSCVFWLYIVTAICGEKFIIIVQQYVITGPSTHCMGARLVTVADVCRRLSSSSVTLHRRPAGGFTRAGQAMTSCRLQSNYSSMVTLHGGPVVLRPVRATLCFNNLKQITYFYIRSLLATADVADRGDIF